MSATPGGTPKGQATAQWHPPTTGSTFTMDPASLAFSGLALAAGDWVFFMLGASSSVANAAAISMPPGFVEVFSFRNMGQPDSHFSGTTSWGVWARKRLATDGAYTFAVDRSGTHTSATPYFAVFWLDGYTTPDSSRWLIGAPNPRYLSGGTNTDIALSTNVVAAKSMALAFFSERTTAADTDAGHTISGAGWTKSMPTFIETDTGICTFDLAYKPMASPGGTGDVTRTCNNTQSINGQAFQLILPPVNRASQLVRSGKGFALHPFRIVSYASTP